MYEILWGLHGKRIIIKDGEMWFYIKCPYFSFLKLEWNFHEYEENGDISYTVQSSFPWNVYKVYKISNGERRYFGKLEQKILRFGTEPRTCFDASGDKFCVIKPHSFLDFSKLRYTVYDRYNDIIGTVTVYGRKAILEISEDDPAKIIFYLTSSIVIIKSRLSAFG